MADGKPQSERPTEVDRREGDVAYIPLDAATLQDQLRPILDEATDRLLDHEEVLREYRIRTGVTLVVDLDIEAQPGESERQIYRKENEVPFV